MEVKIIDQEQIVEGITASIFFPITIIFFRHFKSTTFIIYSMLAWFTTWIARKISVNVYLHFKKKYGWKDTTYHITI